MLTKLKVLAAMAATMTLECVQPNMPAAPPADRTEVSRQGLTIPALPPAPTAQTLRTWERGMHTGLVTSGAQDAQLVLMKDVFTTGHIKAFGFDPVSGTNLFVFTLAASDYVPFVQMWAMDVGQWRTTTGTAPGLDCITDGIGGTPPQPRPGFDYEKAWAHSFYAHSMQQQIMAEY